MGEIRAAMNERLYPGLSREIVELARMGEDSRRRMDAEYQRAVLGQVQVPEWPPLGIHQPGMGWL